MKSDNRIKGKIQPEERAAAMRAVMQEMNPDNVEALVLITKNADGTIGTGAYGSGPDLLDCLLSGGERILSRMQAADGMTAETFREMLTREGGSGSVH